MTGSVMTSSEMGQRKSSGHDACLDTSMAWARGVAAGGGEERKACGTVEEEEAEEVVVVERVRTGESPLPVDGNGMMMWGSERVGRPSGEPKKPRRRRSVSSRLVCIYPSRPTCVACASLAIFWQILIASSSLYIRGLIFGRCWLHRSDCRMNGYLLVIQLSIFWSFYLLIYLQLV